MMAQNINRLSMSALAIYFIKSSQSLFQHIADDVNAMLLDFWKEFIRRCCYKCSFNRITEHIIKFRKQFRICLIRMMGQNSNCHTSQFDNLFDIKILFSRSQFVFGLDMYILQLGHNLISWYKLWLLLNYLLCKVNQKLKKHVKNYKKCIFSHS